MERKVSQRTPRRQCSPDPECKPTLYEEGRSPLFIRHSSDCTLSCPCGPLSGLSSERPRACMKGHRNVCLYLEHTNTCWFRLSQGMDLEGLGLDRVAACVCLSVCIPRMQAWLTEKPCHGESTGQLFCWTKLLMTFV